MGCSRGCRSSLRSPAGARSSPGMGAGGVEGGAPVGGRRRGRCLCRTPVRGAARWRASRAAIRMRSRAWQAEDCAARRSPGWFDDDGQARRRRRAHRWGSGQPNRQARTLRFFLWRSSTARSSSASRPAGRAGLWAGDPRQARSHAPAEIWMLGARGPKLASAVQSARLSLAARHSFRHLPASRSPIPRANPRRPISRRS